MSNANPGKNFNTMPSASMCCRISIVTPSFNQAQFLERTVRSVLDQQYPHVEYLVMDGSSSDGSVAIIRRYENRLAYWQSQPDGGQADAIQRGFQLASGDVLAYLNSDDVLLPGALQRVADVFSTHPECQLLVGNSLRIDAHRLLKRVWACPLNYKRMLFGGTRFDQPASFWRRDLFFENSGLDTSLQFCFDYDLYLRMAQRAPVARCQRVLGSLRIHPSSRTFASARRASGGNAANSASTWLL